MTSRGSNRPVGLGFLVVAALALLAAAVLGEEGSTGVYLLLALVCLVVGAAVLLRRG